MTTWLDRLVAAEVRGSFTDEDKALANAWTTCKVGEEHERNPSLVIFMRVDDYASCPWEEHLYALGSGSGFYGAVRDDNIPEAWQYYHAIEDRVLALKREVEGA